MKIRRTCLNSARILKARGLLVRIRSMQDKFSELSKHVGSLMVFAKSELSQKLFM